jgi:hypothetical protein
MVRRALTVVLGLACMALVATSSGLAATSPIPTPRGNWAAETICRSWSDILKYPNQGACTSTSARLGPANPPFVDPSVVCEYFGGTFAFGDSPILWTCTNVFDPRTTNLRNDLQEQMFAICFATGGNILVGGYDARVRGIDAEFDPNFYCGHN